MEEKTLLKIATFFALIGIIILAFISNNTNLEYNDISSIDNTFLDKKVHIKGNLINLISTEKVKILTIKDKTGLIKAVTFQEQELNLQNNDLLEITGKLITYQGEFEILADSIIKFE